MFTGLITHTAKIKSAEPDSQDGIKITLVNPFGLEDALTVGESIAVNGCCLTVLPESVDRISFYVSPETIRRCGSESWSAGTRVNLERSLRVGDRLGGHIVSGHIDAQGEFVWSEADGESLLLTFSYEPEFARYLIEKGSVCVNGVSLTIADLIDESDLKNKFRFTVCVIPHTAENTNLGVLQIGDSVQLEFDQFLKTMIRNESLAKSLSERKSKLEKLGKQELEVDDLV